MAKFLPKLSEQTDRLRTLLKKNEPWIWGDEQQKDFKKNKTNVNRRPMLGTLRKRQR